MKRHPLMEQYCQGIVFDLVQRGLILTAARKTGDLFTVTIKWPVPCGRDLQSVTCNGATLLDALEQADRQAGKLLPVKCSAELE